MLEKEKIIEYEVLVKTYILEYGLKLIGTVFVLLIFWILAGWISAAARKTFVKTSMDETLAKFLSKSLRWGVIIFAFFICLSIFGINTTGLATIIGAGGLAIGLAFQGTLSNIAAGLMLLFFRPFKVGDIVKIEGYAGKIYEIELFTTSLNTFDNKRIIVPNSKIFGSTIENVTYNTRRRVDVPVAVSYDADISTTRKTLINALSSMDKVLQDPEPVVFLSKLGDFSVDWEIRAWCLTGDWAAVHEAVVQAVKEALDANGIVIPFPRMDIAMSGQFAKEV